MYLCIRSEHHCSQLSFSLNRCFYLDRIHKARLIMQQTFWRAVDRLKEYLVFCSMLILTGYSPEMINPHSIYLMTAYSFLMQVKIPVTQTSKVMIDLLLSSYVLTLHVVTVGIGIKLLILLLSSISGWLQSHVQHYPFLHSDASFSSQKFFTKKIHTTSKKTNHAHYVFPLYCFLRAKFLILL